MSSEKEYRFLRSAMDERGAVFSTDSIREWLASRNREVQVRVERTRLSRMRDWGLEEASGRVRHASGKFFSIDGIRVATNWGHKPEWAQPIINQPEIGLLGCVAREFNGRLHFLIQAKVEPGNVNCVQLSPTLQATKSNYTRVHHGKSRSISNGFRTEPAPRFSWTSCNPNRARDSCTSATATSSWKPGRISLPIRISSGSRSGRSSI